MHTTLSPYLNYLKARITEGKVALFVGAGVSREADLPASAELTQRFASLLTDYNLDVCDDLGKVSEYYDYKFRGDLIRRLAEWLDDKDQIGESHKLIPRLNWRAIYTTNYDELLEKGFDYHQKSYEKIVNPQQMRILVYRPGITPIYKLHGCISSHYRYDRDSPIVITDEHYENYAPRRTDLINRLRQFLLEGNLLLFLGYRMADPFWTNLRKEVGGILQQAQYFAVMPSFDKYAAEYWQRRQVVLLQATAQELLEQLV